MDTRSLVWTGPLAVAMACFGQGCSGQSESGSSATCESVPGISAARTTIAEEEEQGTTLNGITLNGTSLNGLTLNGITLNGISLNGTGLVAGVAGVPDGARFDAVLSDGSHVTLDLVSHEIDAQDPEVTYYRLAYQGQDLCSDGRGLFVAGTWDKTGARHDDPTMVSYSCMNGAIAKCVAWGYKPWRVGADLHQSCTRMVRADYCGDGLPHTRNGTRIDVFDTQGVESPAGDPSLTFEAAWGPNGAVCVSQPRYYDEVRGSVVLPSCWSQKWSCASLDEAQKLGAKLANASAHATRNVCGGAIQTQNDR